MPTTSPAQHRLMEAAAHTPGGYGGVPQAVGKEFVEKDADPATAAAPAIVAPIEAAPIQAAGIIFLTPEGQALFVQRSDQSDCAGCWAFPGGKLEPDEVAEEAALREAVEEVGPIPDGERRPVRRVTLSGVDFTTFVQEVDAPFEPTLNDEHTAWTWAPITAPPGPLHPGVPLALEPLLPLDELTETDIARKVMAGELPSPTMMRGMALFALRVTGTGLSYRGNGDEHVWRDPSHYLNQEFLDRCAGLPVLWKHTRAGSGPLASDEFNARVIGTCMFAWIQGDEVWAMARIYDAEAIARMTGSQLSTSPAVFFGPADGNATVLGEGGQKLLVEGRPYLLDHLAVVPVGVWDKDGPPTGVLNETMSMRAEMADNTGEVADRKDTACAPGEVADARRDGDTDWKAAFDELKARMDAMDKERADAAARRDAAEKEAAEKAAADAAARRDAAEKEAAEKAAADAARRDGEPSDKEDREKIERAEKEAADARKDAAAVRQQMEELTKTLTMQQAAIQALSANIPRSPSEPDHDKFTAEQARFDAAYVALGERAPAPMMGERLSAYTVRLARQLKPHSQAWKEIDISRFDEAALNVAATQIIADAMKAAKSTDRLPQEGLISRTETKAGREITRWYGRGTFIRDMKAPTMRATAFRHRDNGGGFRHSQGH